MNDDQSNRPRNILYIFTDDQSFRSVSCYPGAHSWISTPNIDRLAHEGMRFSNCYTSAWCAPSRATYLTGKLPHGVMSLHLPSGYPNYVRDPDRCPYWLENLRENGWYTGIVGKWHTGPDHGHGRYWDFSAIWDHSQPEKYGPYYVNQNMSINGGPPEPVGGYSTDNYTEYALEFLRGRAEEPDKPWHLWLCYDAVHGPWAVADRHLQDYPDVPQVPTPEDIYPPRPTKATHMRDYGVWREGDQGQGEDTDVGCGEPIGNPPIPWWVSLCTGKYKYIRWLVPGEIEEMYNLENDPEELENLALESDYHELLAQFRQGTIDELRRTDAGMVDNLPQVKVLTKEQLLGGADRV